MSNLFNAKLIISSYDIINDNEWSIKSKIVDNNGNFVANNAQVGDIIWDENDIIPIEPLIGTEAVIGSASNNLG